MCTLKWDPLFDPKEKTTTITWLSFPFYHQISLERKQFFSLAAMVTEALQVGKTTWNNRGPSCPTMMSRPGRTPRSNTAYSTSKRSYTSLLVCIHHIGMKRREEFKLFITKSIWKLFYKK